MQLNKLELTIGIAAYNSQRNLGKMLRALLRQRQNNFNLKKIIVHSDASTDDTVKIARRLKNSKIITIDNHQRKGFAGSVKTILEKASGDVVVLLNDDIKIKDENLINKLIEPFLVDKNAGLVCGNPQPLKPQNFIENAIYSSFRAYHCAAERLNEGCNKFTVDGKILVLSKTLIKKDLFPQNLKHMGNVDIYLYLYTLSKKFSYHFVKSAVVYYKNPSNFKDYTNWFSRNNANEFIDLKSFGILAQREYKKPANLKKYLIIEFIKNPLGGLFLFFSGFYIDYKSKLFAKNFNPRWEVVSTTKSL